MPCDTALPFIAEHTLSTLMIVSTTHKTDRVQPIICTVSTHVAYHLRGQGMPRNLICVYLSHPTFCGVQSVEDREVASTCDQRPSFIRPDRRRCPFTAQQSLLWG